MKFTCFIPLLMLTACEHKSPMDLVMGQLPVQNQPPVAGGGPPTVTVYKAKEIILMAGQSNMLGIGQDDSSPETAYFPKSPAVKMIFTDGHEYAMAGPGAAAGLFYTRAHPGLEFIGVMCAKGSTSINVWGPGSELLEACIARARIVAEEAHAPITHLFFDQGEQDAWDWTPDWAHKLFVLAEYTRTSLGLASLPVVYSQIGVNDNEYQYEGRWAAFKEIQAQAQQPGFSMVKTDDVPAIRHVHHDAAANWIIGERFFQRM